MGWLYFVSYLLGIVPVWRLSARWILEAIERRNPDDVDFERPYIRFVGLIIALVWPFGMPALVLGWLAYRLAFPTGLKTRQEEKDERADREREELDKLRKLAREHNLPGWE